MDKSEQLDGQKLAYVEWFLDPWRKPRSQAAYAAEHEMSRTTLWNWEQADWFVALTKKHTGKMESAWEASLRTLAAIATDRTHPQCVSAIREMGKLLSKYPAEKVNVTVDRVSYVDPSVLASLSVATHPELQN